MKSIFILLLIVYISLVVPFSKGSEETDTTDVYEIDYRGPETHNSRPPPETKHDKPPYVHHNISAAGSSGAHVGAKN